MVTQKQFIFLIAFPIFPRLKLSLVKENQVVTGGVSKLADEGKSFTASSIQEAGAVTAEQHLRPISLLLLLMSH